jgi:hypothetical protein
MKWVLVVVPAAVALAGCADRALPIPLPGGARVDDMGTNGVTLADGGRCQPVTACAATVGCGEIADGCGGTVDCGPCQLLALTPAIANAGAEVTLEGSFGTDATVQFPGAGAVSVTELGPHRAVVTVPKDVTAGDLTVTTNNHTVGPLPFRRASFSLGLGPFASRSQQPDGGHQSATLVTARRGHTTVVVGDNLYVIGGADGNKWLDSVERATINADGSLSSFTTVVGASLTQPRSFHSSVVIGNNVYVIGGYGAGGALASVERATINADGSLSSFAPVAGVALTTASLLHSSLIIGNNVYVLGGHDGYDGGSHAIASVERATIKPNGSLSNFAVVPNVALSAARYGHTSQIIGHSLYVLGGFDGSGDGRAIASVERATINADGSLSRFATVASTLATPRGYHASIVIGNSLVVIGWPGQPVRARHARQRRARHHQRR